MGKGLWQPIREVSCNFHSIGEPIYWSTNSQKISNLLNSSSQRKHLNYIESDSISEMSLIK